MAMSIQEYNRQSKIKAREILSLVPLLTDSDLAELIAELRKRQLSRNLNDKVDTTTT